MFSVACMDCTSYSCHSCSIVYYSEESAYYVWLYSDATPWRVRAMFSDAGYALVTLPTLYRSWLTLFILRSSTFISHPFCLIDTTWSLEHLPLSLKYYQYTRSHWISIRCVSYYPHILNSFSKRSICIDHHLIGLQVPPYQPHIHIRQSQSPSKKHSSYFTLYHHDL